MSMTSVSTENKSYLVTSDKIKKAIAIFRESFPDNVELASIPDSEIEVRVEEFIKSKQTITPDINTPQIEKITAQETSTSCPVLLAIVIIDCILMILRFTGLHVANNETIKQAVIKEISKKVNKNLPEWQEMIAG
jgi:hypothetical protein